MARIDKDLIILIGRDRENPRTHRDAFQITGGLGEMLDEHIKRNNLNKSEFIREAIAAKLEAEMPKEPLIKDKKIRKAVRAWAALYDWSAIRVHIGEDYVALFKDEVNGYSSSVEIDLSPEVFNELIDAHYYTIEELCGEEEE